MNLGAGAEVGFYTHEGQLDAGNGFWSATINKVLDHLAAEVGSTVELSHEYFWSVPLDDLFEVTHLPAAMTTGQVSEALGFLRSSLDEDRVLVYDLVGLADVLRANGAQVDG